MVARETEYMKKRKQKRRGTDNQKKKKLVYYCFCLFEKQKKISSLNPLMI